MKKVDLSSIKRVPSVFKRIPYKKVLLVVVLLIIILTGVIGGRYVYVHKIRKPRDIGAEQRKTQDKLIELAGKKDCKGLEKVIKKTDKQENGFAINFQHFLGLGDCYTTLNNNGEAERYYREALKLAESVKDAAAIEVAQAKLAPPKTGTKTDSTEVDSDKVL